MIKDKVIYVLGADGYIGWPLSLRLTALGAHVIMVDSLSKRGWESSLGVAPLLPIAHWSERIRDMYDSERLNLALEGDELYALFERFPPEAVVHLGEQPSAPLSMLSRGWAHRTQHSNVLGTLNLMFAVMHSADREKTSPAHIVKLGSMGEYGTPGIPIEEGWLNVHHRGYSDRVLFPKRPGSFYHASKVHDSHNLEFGCRAWGLKVTDLNQGVVWGLETEDAPLGEPARRTSFHYDEVFGTVVNRFLSQACVHAPLSVYGTGGQRRGFIHLEDSLRCIITALENPPHEGEFRVANQLTELASIQEIANLVARVCKVPIEHIPNPRVESEDHLYTVEHSVLPMLGFEPTVLLTEDSIASAALTLGLCAGTQLMNEAGNIGRRPVIRWRKAR